MMERGDVGIEPNMVFLVSWLERQGVEKIKSLKYEEQTAAYKRTWFSALLRFHDLIASPRSFDPEKFQRFIDAVRQSDSMRYAYKTVAMHLREKYEDGAIDAKAGSITYQLIGLAEEVRESFNTVGRRDSEEERRRRREPGYHPGD
jgi:hypothetical protein